MASAVAKHALVAALFSVSSLASELSSQMLDASCDPALTEPCMVSSYTNISTAVSCCSQIILSNITVPGGQSLDLTGLKSGTTVTFAGLTTFQYADKNYDMIKISGTNITITSEPGAIIDGNGQAWWDGQGSNGGVSKPNRFITVNNVRGNSVIQDLHIQNYPVHCFGITNSANLLIQNITLDMSAGNAPNSRSKGLPAAHNSDGFGIGTSDGVVLRDSWVSNQDDCVAVTSGNNITISGMWCNGSHGLSIGSIGGKMNNNVTNILFANSTVANSENGVRIKSNYNTTGYIAGVTYRNIALVNITKYGLDIQQDYLNGGPNGTPSNGVVIKDLLMHNVTGTTASSGRNYYILCGQGSCSNFTFSGVSIRGGKKNSSCNFEPAGAFSCS